MNFTTIAISMIVAIAVVSGLNIFVGDVFTQYNTSESVGMTKYALNDNASSNSYISSVTSLSSNLEQTANKVPDTSFLGTLISGFFWTMDSVKTFFQIPTMLGGIGSELNSDAGGSGLLQIPGWTYSIIFIIIGVIVTGYIIYLLIGKGDRYGNI